MAVQNPGERGVVDGLAVDVQLLKAQARGFSLQL